MNSRGFVSRTTRQQAYGLTIIGVSKVMTRAGTPCKFIIFSLAVETEIFCASMFVGLIIVGAQRSILLSSSTFLVGGIPHLVSLLAFLFLQQL